MSGSPDHVGRILGRGTIYTLATALQLGAGVLVLPALTRTLDPREYALVAAALVVYWLVGALAGLGMPAAIARAYFLPGGKTGVRTLTVAALSIAIVITILVEATGPLWSKVFEGVSYAGALRAAAFAGVPLTVLLATQQVLRAQDR
ncbi:MAG TPA: oligosaccharide flippase family protein, partial [Polyangia bacterium]|nr:oligosaccharide flippase family protein [Polyangia bacterium]